MANSITNVSFGSDYQTEADAIARRRKLAEMLQGQGMSPLEQPATPAGGFTPHVSPFQGLAKMAQSYAGALGQRKADEQQQALSQRYQSDLANVLTRAGSATGAPAQPAIPQPSAELGGGPGRPDMPAQSAEAQQMGIYASHPATQPIAMHLAQQQAQRQALVQALGGAAGQGGAGGAPGAPQSVGGLPMQAWLQIDPTGKAYAQAVQHQQITPYQQATLDNTRSAQTETARHNSSTEGQARRTLAETSRHHAALEGDPETVEQTAQAIASGKLAPLSGFALARPMAQNIMARVVQINPDFDPTQFQTRQKAEKDFATGEQGNTVKSFNVALSHLDTLDQLADGLNNKNAQLINRAANAYATQTGSPAPTNFEAAKKIVGDEIVKAIVGSGGGVADREEAAKTISAASSPAQLKGVIATYKELMRGQINGLRNQYKSSTGKEDFDTKFLSGEGKSVEHGAQGKTVDWNDL